MVAKHNTVHHLQGVEAIAAGFPVDMDRYDKSLCEQDPHASRLALVLESHPFHNPPEWVKARMKQVVRLLYNRMERDIQVVPCEGEPYLTAEEMIQDVHGNARLFVRRKKVCPVVGALCQEWRAVHDYYGHVEQHAPFTLRGELAAYTKHVTQFPRECWPFLWNTVVLENAFRLNRGHFLCFNEQCSSKVVFDEVYFGVPAPGDYYNALM